MLYAFMIQLSVYNLATDMVPWGTPPSPIYTAFAGSCTIYNSFKKTGLTTDDLAIWIGIFSKFFLYYI